MILSRSINKPFLLVILLSVVYNFIFWQEKAGLNLVLFTVLCSAAVLILNHPGEYLKKLILLILAVIYSAATVLINNSGFSMVSLVASVVVFTGFAQQKQLKSIYCAALTVIAGMAIFPYNFIEGARKIRKKYKVFAFVFKTGKLVLLPALIFSVFYSLYAYANPMFNSYSVSFWDRMGEFISKIFYDYPFGRFAFIFSGAFLVTGILYNNNIHLFADIDNRFLDFLSRNKINKLVLTSGSKRYTPLVKKIHLFEPKMFSLITEFRIGSILLIMVNLLIMILNIIDIKFLWFGFDSKQVDNLAYYVHEGTYVLIFSIVLSMFILLYVFRANLNFYSKNKWLKYTAYLWIIQNGIMAISVGLRNYYYIEYYYALSYKRIGVMIFLLLAFTGLVTMFLKIRYKRTTYNLVKINALAAFIVILLISAFNWDVYIAKFNLTNPDKNAIDTEYLLSLSADVLPLIDANKEILNKTYFDYGHHKREVKKCIDLYTEKQSEFLKNYDNYTWLSWNYPDWQTYIYFNRQKDYFKKN